MSDQYSAKANELLLAALDKDQLAYMTVQSDSMAPLFRRGDQMQITSLTTNSLEIGDVIVFGQLEDLIAHRFLGVHRINGRIYMLTRGDHLPYYDPFVAKDQLRAIVVGRRRSGRIMSLDRGPGATLNRCLSYLARLEAQVLQLPLPTGRLWPGGVARNGRLGRLARRLFHAAASLLVSLTTVLPDQRLV